jgi:homoserine acetyltransferase
VAYGFAVDGDALHFLLSRKSSERRELLKFFRALANDPYQEGDFREENAEGRSLEVALRGIFLITYWSDHAVRQVRVLRIETA